MATLSSPYSSVGRPRMWVGGYYISFESTRTFMKELDIDDRGLPQERLEHAINTWFVDRNKLNILAGSIPHPKKGSKIEDGMLFMTQFAPAAASTTEPELTEGRNEEEVKQWLLTAGGLKLEELEWLSLEDKYNLTLRGTKPHRSARRGPDASNARHVSSEQLTRWASSGVRDLAEWLKQEAAEGRWTL
ncbi:hypothetical protein QCA50_000897 [Cerrena zonata]|uniref:Uncharacterized protein n=1 Tax=Cerrena zonata TaxID=2478898 RepID=A0AAW0GXJ7_9APHY